MLLYSPSKHHRVFPNGWFIDGATTVYCLRQVWTWVCLSAPGLGAAAWSAWAWAPAPRLLHPGRARAVLACGGEAPAQLAPLAPALALLASCVVLAVRTRKLPHNFNETRYCVKSRNLKHYIGLDNFKPLKKPTLGPSYGPNVGRRSPVIANGSFFGAFFHSLQNLCPVPSYCHFSPYGA